MSATYPTSTETPPPPPASVSHGAPPVPPGWIADWSQEHNAWFYVFTATGATQWEYPNQSPASPPPPSNQYYSQNEQNAYGPGPGPGPDGSGQPGDRGLGKTALAIGGGILAGASLGTLGKKFGGMFGNKPQKQNQPTQVHVYHPVYIPGPQGGTAPPPYYGQGPPMNQYDGGDSKPAMNSYAPMPVGVGAGQTGAYPPNSMSPPLYIYGAVFADKDVTQIVRSLIKSDQSISLTGDTLIQQLGKPWPEAERKAFSVLYAYGDRPMEFLAADTETSIIEIKNESLSKTRMDFCQPAPSRIIAMVWGKSDASTLARRQQLETEGEIECNAEGLGEGGFWSWEPRNLVCYWRNDAGDVQITCGKEGGTMRMPWNALAKWS